MNMDVGIKPNIVEKVMLIVKAPLHFVGGAGGEE
jgi:hypothetical protein